MSTNLLRSYSDWFGISNDPCKYCGTTAHTSREEQQLRREPSYQDKEKQFAADLPG